MDRRTAIKAAVAGVAGAFIAPLVSAEPVRVSQQLVQRDCSELWCHLSWQRPQDDFRVHLAVRVNHGDTFEGVMRNVPLGAAGIEWRMFYRTVPQWISVETYRA